MTGDSGSEAATSSEASPPLLRWNLLDESVEQETTNSNRTRISSLTALMPLEESSNEGLTSLNIVNKKIKLKWKGFFYREQTMPWLCFIELFLKPLLFTLAIIYCVLKIMSVSRVQTRLHSGLEATLTTIRKNKISLFHSLWLFFSLFLSYIYFLLPVYLRRIFLQLI